MTTIPMIERLGDNFIPQVFRKRILIDFDRANIRPVPYRALGILNILTTVISLILTAIILLTDIFSNAAIIFRVIVGLVLLPFIIFITHYLTFFGLSLLLSSKIYYKTRKMEEEFPEFLSELSLNLTAGQNLEEALQNSAEREFHYLSYEITQICKKVRLGVEVEKAIRDFTASYDSEVIEETFELILTSWKKGAATSQLVQRIYDNLSIISYLKNKVVASVSSYRIFLSSVTVVIAPIMFALAYHLIALVRAIINKILSESSGSAMPITLNAVRVNMDQFQLFSILALVAISTTTAMIIAIIRYGSIKEGYKQILLFAGGSYLIYKIALVVLGYFFTLFNV
ncbi:MAG TPA: type II secretion system F family protein [Acidobacteriota bacterium]|nr:type II secretion system F family protein [Acidobacteriota bacterium]